MNSSFWHLDQESEASVLGSHFANAVAAIATGRVEEFAPKPVPTRKTYFQEPRYNPNLQYAHITSGFDAYFLEESRHWQRRSVPFDRRPRITQVALQTEDHGPKHPESFSHVFEQPIVSFGRNRAIRPQSRLKTAHTRPNPDIVQSLRMKNVSHVTPLSYRLPDPWKQSSSGSLSASISRSHSSVFKSRTKRLDPLSRASTTSKSYRYASPGIGNGSLLEASDSFIHLPTSNLQSSSLTSPPPDNHLGVIDDHIRPRSSNMQSLAHEYPHSPVVPAHNRPMSPTIATITHSRLPGFTFSNIDKDQPIISSNGIDSEHHLQSKIYLREPAKDGSGGYIIRPTSLDEYMEKKQLICREIGQPEYHHIDPLPAIATTAADTSSPQQQQTKQQPHHYYPRLKSKQKVPRTKVVKYHDMFRNKRSEILHMDDSILDDDSKSQISHGDDLSLQDDDDDNNKEQHDGGKKKKASYNKVLLSKWTPPMCYSKKSVNHHNNNSSSAIIDANYPLFNSEEGMEDYIVHKSPMATSRRLSSAASGGAKTFQDMDRHLRSQARQRMISPPEVKLGKYQQQQQKSSA